MHLEKKKKGWITYTVTKIEEESKDTKTIYFEDKDDGAYSFEFRGGQYLTFRFDGLDRKPLARSYSLSSSPREKGFLAFTVKEIQGGKASPYLVRQLKENDTLKAIGPIGKFIFNEKENETHLVFIAAGSGVTPFISMLKEFEDRLTEDHCPSAMTLIVSYKDQENILFRVLLKEMNLQENINIHISLSQEKASEFESGRIDIKMVNRLLNQDLLNKTFFICGPQLMMDQISEHLRIRGVFEKNIITESFA